MPANNADHASESLDPHVAQLGQAASASEAQRANHVRAALVAARKIENRLQLPIAKLLTEVRTQRYWKQWGHRSFEEFVENDCHFSLRKAQELIRLYTKLVMYLGIAPERIAHLGWSKVALVAGELTPANVEQMLLEIEQKSYGELRAWLKTMNKHHARAKKPGKNRWLIVTPIIAAAINKAAEATGSGDPQLNLEFVAQSYLARAAEFRAMSRPGLN